MARSTASILFVLIAILTLPSCAYQIKDYRVIEVGTRREYIAHGQPTFLPGGGISFTDVNSGRMVTLQNYEIEGINGEDYKVVTDPMSGRPVLAPVRKNNSN